MTGDAGVESGSVAREAATLRFDLSARCYGVCQEEQTVLHLQGSHVHGASVSVRPLPAGTVATLERIGASPRGATADQTMSPATPSCAGGAAAWDLPTFHADHLLWSANNGTARYQRFRKPLSKRVANNSLLMSPPTLSRESGCPPTVHLKEVKEVEPPTCQ